MTPRLPDFLIIGAMKSGTTSLFRWLGDHPGFSMPAVKEPDFFSRDDRWAAGLADYTALFAAVPDHLLTGEASTSYTGEHSSVAASRIAATLPAVKLVFVARDPAERLRSHYRHEVQRGRETRPLREAVHDVSSGYVMLSLYWERLTPYIEAFPRDQLCIVRFEDLVSDDATGWDAVLRFLSADRRARAAEPHNVTADKRQFTNLLSRQWQRNRLSWVRRLPRPARRLGKAVMTRDNAGYREKMAGSIDEPLPEHVVDAFTADSGRLAAWLGETAPLWP